MNKQVSSILPTALVTVGLSASIAGLLWVGQSLALSSDIAGPSALFIWGLLGTFSGLLALVALDAE